MANEPGKHHHLKEKVQSEMKEYAFIAGYFALFFLALTTYRKLILAEYGIGYFAYGWSLIQAAILGKVVLIGHALHLGHRFEDRPLLFAMVWKSVVYSLFAALLIGLEHVLEALLHHKPISSEFQLSGGHGYEMVARFQIMLVAFVPFFAFGDLARIVGRGSLSKVLLGARRNGEWIDK